MSTDAERRTQRILQIADRIREAFPGKTLHPIGKPELGSRDELFRIDDKNEFERRLLRMHFGVLTAADLDPIDLMEQQGTIQLLPRRGTL